MESFLNLMASAVALISDRSVSVFHSFVEVLWVHGCRCFTQINEQEDRLRGRRIAYVSEAATIITLLMEALDRVAQGRSRTP